MVACPTAREPVEQARGANESGRAVRHQEAAAHGAGDGEPQLDVDARGIACQDARGPPAAGETVGGFDSERTLEDAFEIGHPCVAALTAASCVRLGKSPSRRRTKASPTGWSAPSTTRTAPAAPFEPEVEDLVLARAQVDRAARDAPGHGVARRDHVAARRQDAQVGLPVMVATLGIAVHHDVRQRAGHAHLDPGAAGVVPSGRYTVPLSSPAVVSTSRSSNSSSWPSAESVPCAPTLVGRTGGWR